MKTSDLAVNPLNLATDFQLLGNGNDTLGAFPDHMGKQKFVQKQKGGTHARGLISRHCL